MLASDLHPQKKSPVETQSKVDALEQLVCRIAEVSTLPHIAFRLIKITQSPNPNPKEMCNVLSSDPVMSSRVLRCVNSSVYGLSQPITNLYRAVCMLGYVHLRDLAMTASVATVFQGNETCGKYVRSKLWRHMIGVAICARMIAARCELPDFESTYLAGLLHDIGIILVDQYEHEIFDEMMINFPQNSKVNLTVIEQEKLGYDHTMLGARIAQTWGLEGPLLDVIRHHHDVSNYDGEYPQILACVDLANLLCTLRGWSSIGHKIVDANQWSMEQLNLTPEDVQILNEDLGAELELYRELIRIGMTA